MKILITGRNGQVGWELERSLAPLGEVIATDRATLDLADLDALRRVMREVRPEVVVNAAAYTAVDKAESEPELAYAVNSIAPGVLAEEARRLGALLVHYSTDYVFDGTRQTPYLEEDEPNPLNVYGASKLAGERAIQASGCRHLILRTSWVYGTRGKNFMLTILRAARVRAELRVVADQFGTPTSTLAIARVSSEMLGSPRLDRAADGIYHFCAVGRTSWFGFAEAILACAGARTPIVPVSSSEYPTPAKRPGNSVLDTGKLTTTFGLRLGDWGSGLREVWASLNAPRCWAPT